MIMIAATTIFLPLNFHNKCLELLSIKKRETKSERITRKQKKNVLFVYYLMVLFLGIQVLMPLRHHIFSNNIYWDEIGYRFSWRVMLMEKNGYTNIVVIDPRKEIQYQLDQDLYLSKFQQQQMKSTTTPNRLPFPPHKGGWGEGLWGPRCWRGWSPPNTYPPPCRPAAAE